MFACIFSVEAMCPDGMSQGNEWTYFDHTTQGFRTVCPVDFHTGGYCCYNPCGSGGDPSQ